MNETRAAQAWINARLGAAAAVTALVSTRIYDSLAPQGAALPYIIASYQSGQVTTTVGGQSRIVAQPVFLIKGVAEGGSFVTADQIAAALDDALLGAAGTTVTLDGVAYRVDSAVQVVPIRYVELLDGRRINHSGGLYRLFVYRA